MYIRIISFGYGMMEVHHYCGFIMTGMHRPAAATALRVLVLLIPLSYAAHITMASEEFSWQDWSLT